MGKFDDPVALRKERVQAYKGAIRKDVEPTRIPTYNNGHTWWIFDAGYELTECMFDYTKMYDAVCRNEEIYQWDAYTATGSRNCATYAVSEAQFSENGIYNLEKKQGLNVADKPKILDNEYREKMEKGTLKFMFENYLSRMYDSKEAAYKGLAHAAHVAWETAEYGPKIDQRLYNHYGVPMQACNIWGAPFEDVMNNRGLKNLSIDVRRQADLLDEYCQHMFEENGGVEGLRASYNPDLDTAFTFWTYGLGHVFLNAKQFDRYYAPYFKKFTDLVEEVDGTAMFLMEGTIQPMKDHFRDYKDGHYVMYLENDDIRQFKKEFPNMTPLGGVGRTNLGLGTPQDCIDEAKGLIDDVGYDGKYILTTASIMSWPIDGKGENLKAMMDFVREYGVMKK